MTRSVKMTGKLSLVRNVYQDVAVKSPASTRETFTLSGWAKGYGIPVHERDGLSTPVFRLRALITYTNGTTQAETADFSPSTEEWQFASVQFAKNSYRAIRSIRVFCEYNYNFGDVYFDDIQLIRDSIETDLTSDEFNGEVDEEAAEETVTETTETAEVFKEATDTHGNALTETTFTDGEFGTIYRAFGYDEDGNDLVLETDARGNETHYTVDEDTSRNEEVTDRCGNKTAYEYDDSGRTIGVTSKDASGTALATVSYAYDAFDNMTEIVRGDGMKYVLAYNAFHNLESIGVQGKAEKLISYTYKNENGRLKEMTYANGDRMTAVYNSLGQMIAEKWYDVSDVLTAYYKYVYDGNGNIVRSIDISGKKEYNYEYEEGRIVRATEADIELSGEIVTSISTSQTK